LRTSLGERRDLKFRTERLFCNIEPKKRQYGCHKFLESGIQR
jgi:hypothetical protein